MNRYRELLAHQLAIRHVGLELDLNKANQQAPFICRVDEVLSRLTWDYVQTMDNRFDVTFVIQTGKVALEHQILAVEQELSLYFDIERKLDGSFSVESFRQPEGACCVKLGDFT